MSELKAYTIYEGDVGNYTEHVVYSKSEADEVFAEKDKEIADLKERIQEERSAKVNYKMSANDLSDGLKDAYEEIKHHKYKRGLAMAKYCEATALWCYQAANTLPIGFKATLHGKPVMIEPERLFKRFAIITKWEIRWLKLAEKFKEAK